MTWRERAHTFEIHTHTCFEIHTHERGETKGGHSNHVHLEPRVYPSLPLSVERRTSYKMYDEKTWRIPDDGGRLRAFSNMRRMILASRRLALECFQFHKFTPQKAVTFRQQVSAK